MVFPHIIEFLADIIQSALLSGGEGTWRGIKFVGCLMISLGFLDLLSVYFGMNILPGIKSKTEGYILTVAMMVMGILVFIVGKIGDMKQQRRKRNN